ncbi:EmrB/QacA subfamily drug resistance transporter [Rathayibacter sp. PhB127]|uniref:MFS transporter n=1 Tax=Rathayibacter sp. PhB127 TaxID=2485176 RepID=UPI000FB8888D|nr:MFS transporter [Rathayibacter sp. PhB127]ROS28308.1 EmrB/QacA subfamily drug resistance transporter [Rathayibacter sp. PhB127]
MSSRRPPRRTRPRRRPALDPRRQRAIAFLVAGCFFMENLDATIVTTAAPAIGADLGVDSAAVAITVTAFLLTVAVLIPASGWLSERFGVRRVFTTAIAVFTLASLLCALSPTLPLLVTARVLQGVGGALMVPVGRLAVLRVTPREGIIRAIAILVWPGLVAPILAPFVGGLLTTYASWHWIFLINLPLGVVAFVIARRIIPAGVEAAPPPLDVVGLLLVAVGLGALVGATGFVTGSGSDTVALGLAVTGALVTAVAVRHLRRTPHPLVPLDAFRFSTFRVANASGSLYRATINAVPFLLPLLFQDAFGWNAVQAGSIVLALFVGNLAIKPATTWLLHTVGFRGVLVAANVVGIACMVAMAFLDPDVPIPAIVALLVLSGVARSAGFTAYNTVTFAEVAPEGMSGANTLSATTQQIAAGFGVAAGGIALAAGSAFGPGLVPYRFAFLTLAVLTLVPLIAAARLPHDSGSTLTR